MPFTCTFLHNYVTAEPEEDREGAELSAAPMAKRPCQCCCQTYSEILSFLEKRSEAEQRLREEEFALRREELEIQRSKSFSDFKFNPKKGYSKCKNQCNVIHSKGGLIRNLI